MRNRVKGIVAVALSLIMMCPVLTAKADFTPSVGYKPAPEIVTKPDGNGNEIIGHVKDPNGNILSTEYKSSIIVTPIAEVNTSKEIPKSAADELKKVYNDIVVEKTKFSNYPDLNKLVEKEIGQGKNGDDLVVRDIFDVTEVSDTLLKYLPGKGNTIDLTFDLDIPADKFVAVMVYKNGQWELMPNVINNGDGTVTVTFEHFSPVAFLVHGTGVKGNLVPVTGDNTMKDITLWLVLLGVSLVAMVGVGVSYRRKRR